MSQLIYTPEQEEEFFDQIDQVYELTESSEFEEAERLLLSLEESILDPKEYCSVGNILLDSIFSFYEQAGQIEKALPYFIRETDFLKEVVQSESIKHPVHFVTTGSIYYALNDLDSAREYFKIAYNLKKGSIFQDFNDDFLHIAIISDEEFEEFKKSFIPNTSEELEDLTEEQQALIDDYCDKGNEEMDKQNFAGAITWFNKALTVLPAPQEDWEAAGWIYASIGDAYFNDGKYTEALENLKAAHRIYGDEEPNPFILLRLGSTYFELGDTENASATLLQAYQLEGPELFEDDKKFLTFLKKQHKL